DQQSSVAFFPAYPTAMRIAGTVFFGNLAVGGVLVSLLCGFGVAVLFHRWVSAFLGERTARLALALLLCYPFAFYLFGVVYSDALFLLAVIGAFSLLERDRPLLAGLAGIVATAARPVGVALVIGLVIRTLEIRGALPGSRLAVFVRHPTPIADTRRSPISLLPRRVRLGAVRPADATVLLSVLGLVAFAALLWVRFDDPLAFSRVSGAPGWGKEFDLETLAKLHLFRLLEAYGLNIVTFWLVVQGLFALLALALVPPVIRCFGWGYGAYLFVSVGIAFASTRDFIGMGRYVLAGFPAFAAAADLLVGWSGRGRGLIRAIPAVAVATSAGLLAWMVSLFARWYFLS
ncbi:MAG: hypothetical protein M3Q68_07505, partial [Actinomycetota bacterium]|nr:hypothetical protein [Actinomycetota bacterium]